MACYGGDNPVKDLDEGIAIWKWAKENVIDQGVTDYDKVHDAINEHFFGGMAKPEWIYDILAGRKSPFRALANELWRKQYNRNAIIQQADALSKIGKEYKGTDLAKQATQGPIMRNLTRLRYAARSVAVFGHGVVFPVTHGGDMLLDPLKWKVATQGMLRTYGAAGSSAFAGRVMNRMARDSMYSVGIKSGLDIGPKSHPVGLLSNSGGKTGFFNAGNRAWDMLTVMRFELWKKQMARYIKPGMSETEVLDYGKNLADWANHATGSGKGPIADFGNLLFGAGLTQSKVSRLTVDPAKTIKSLFDPSATPGEKAVAWTRLRGSVRYLTTYLGFLAVNQGVLKALGSDQNVNMFDASKGDIWSFKGFGLSGYIPGLHTELRLIGKVLQIASAPDQVPGKTKPMVQNKFLGGESKDALIAKAIGEYGMGKLEPGIQVGLEGLTKQNWLGRPVPWSSYPGTEKKPRMSTGEYIASHAPIPLEGPTGYVYDQLKGNGMPASQAMATIRALILFGSGLPGFHVTPDRQAQKN